MAVRSTRLFGPTRPAAVAAFSLLYTVPAGRTWRGWVWVLSVDATARNIGLALGNAGAEVFMSIESYAGVGGKRFDLVLQPGDKLSGFNSATAGGATYTGFGSLLLGAPS